MAATLDHVVILVPSLAEGIAEYTGKGFTVTPGGEHVGGESHNALVTFDDGSYLELIAFTVPKPVRHRWRHHVPGIIDYCLSLGGVEAAIAQFNARGLAYTYFGDGGRKRPDGVQLVWRSGIAPENAHRLPFVIEDVTPRALRVPQGAASAHANGVRGIASLSVSVADVAAATRAYDALLGPAPDAQGYRLGPVMLRLAQGASGISIAFA